MRKDAWETINKPHKRKEDGMAARIMLVMAVGLLSALPVSASIQAKIAKSDPVLNGYVLIGRNVVVLPEMLRSGDRMDFYNSKGDKVLETFVGSGYLAADISRLPQGAYTMVISRKGNIVTSRMTPIIGMAGQ
jgi:hypothetical protein